MMEIICNKIESIEFEFASLTFLDCECVLFTHKNKKVELDDIKTCFFAIRNYYENKLPNCIIDVRDKYGILDNPSKTFLAYNLHKQFNSCAVVENSATMRFLVKNFIAMYRPKLSVEVFKQTNEAYTWFHQLNK
jgi:hypothetical protein